MTTQQDEAKRLRIQDDATYQTLSQIGRDPALGMPSVVAQTTTLSTYPTSPQLFFACTPLTILGLEVEGGGGTMTPGNSVFLALNLGSSIPPIGSSILTTFVDNRWIFRHDG